MIANLTDGQALEIVEVFANKWATFATWAAIPCAERVWDFPVSGPLKPRLAWSRKQSQKARAARKILEVFGVETPADVDLSRYVHPKKPGPHVMPGDLYYSHQSVEDYRRELTAQLVGQLQRRVAA